MGSVEVLVLGLLHFMLTNGIMRIEWAAESRSLFSEKSLSHCNCTAQRNYWDINVIVDTSTF